MENDVNYETELRFENMQHKLNLMQCRNSFDYKVEAVRHIKTLNYMGNAYDIDNYECIIENYINSLNGSVSKLELERCLNG